MMMGSGFSYTKMRGRNILYTLCNNIVSFRTHFRAAILVHLNTSIFQSTAALATPGVGPTIHSTTAAFIVLNDLPTLVTIFSAFFEFPPDFAMIYQNNQISLFTFNKKKTNVCELLHPLQTNQLYKNDTPTPCRSSLATPPAWTLFLSPTGSPSRTRFIYMDHVNIH